MTNLRELSAPFLSQHRCGCGKVARYYHQDVPYVSDITYSCNKDAACPTYNQLCAQLTAANEDTARLDWVGDNVSEIYQHTAISATRKYEYSISHWEDDQERNNGYFHTFRDAIDAAREKMEAFK